MAKSWCVQRAMAIDIGIDINAFLQFTVYSHGCLLSKLALSIQIQCRVKHVKINITYLINIPKINIIFNIPRAVDQILDKAMVLDSKVVLKLDVTVELWLRILRLNDLTEFSFHK